MPETMRADMAYPAAMRVQRHSVGSVRYDKRRKTWNYLWYDGETRRSKVIGTKQQYPTKASAWNAVDRLELGKTKAAANGTLMRDVIARYQAERMPARHSTAYVYRSFLKCHVSPRWGSTPIQSFEPRPVELWLKSLDLSPKSKTHIRSLMHSLLEFAMFDGSLAVGRNPISLVRNPARVAVWQLSKLYRRREYPIVRFTELASLFPGLHTIEQIVSEDESLGGTFRFAFILTLHHDASADRDARLKPIYVGPSQPQTFAYAKSKANACER